MENCSSSACKCCSRGCDCKEGKVINKGEGARVDVVAIVVKANAAALAKIN